MTSASGPPGSSLVMGGSPPEAPAPPARRSSELDGSSSERAHAEPDDRKRHGARPVDRGPRSGDHRNEMLVRRKRLAHTRGASPVLDERVHVPPQQDLRGP